MEIDHPKERCIHEGCRCNVELGKQYCSEHCRNADQNSGPTRPRIQGGACGCGHTDCIQR